MDVLDTLKRRAAILSRSPIRAYYLLSRSGFDRKVEEEAGKDGRIRLITPEKLAEG